METLLDNLSRFAEVLAVARSPWAGGWGEAEAGRAFQWAGYLERLNQRLEGAPGARQALGRHLRSLGPGPPLGRLEELGGQALSEALLCNPAASAAAFHRAAAWRRAAGAGGEGAAWPAALGLAVRAKAAAGLLRLSGGGSGEWEAGAQILRQRLEERLRGPGQLPERRAACEQLLDRAVSDGGEEAVAGLLLAAPGGGGEAEPLVRSWLLGDEARAPQARDRLLGDEARAPPARDGLLGDEARAPPARDGLLGDEARAQPARDRLLGDQARAPLRSLLAARHPAYGRRHLGRLRDWGRGLRYDASGAVWVPRPSWQRLLEHFTALLQGPPPARELAERALRSWKRRDGDFEVWGISVWTDLLLALKM
ncbi:Fanconi anemia group F protein [Scyliorhinus canicula]|uniref:Fanconi anemia group F protein n=1 Tax=Scyliorhinus canicula TaxID=7830 RepID=UPI0018F59BF2|nr:Fanconi anemia group F protein [Scyliorhinus canicula]